MSNPAKTGGASSGKPPVDPKGAKPVPQVATTKPAPSASA